MALNFTGLFPKELDINASYNWIDIASATGYVRFFGFRSNNTDGATYHLSNGKFVSGQFFTNIGPDTTDTLHLDISSDPTLIFKSNVFQLPRTIQGVPIVSIPIAITPPNSSQIYVTVVAKLIKETPGGDTDLTTAITSTQIGGGEGGLTGEESMMNTSIILALPSITNKIIKKGDLIKLEVAYTGVTNTWALFNPSGNAVSISGTDGNLPAPYSALELDVPFRLDFL